MNVAEGHETLTEEKMLEEKSDVDRRISMVGEHGEIINASGHRDQLKRHYSLLSICGLALTIDNAWVALGGSITVSICTSSPSQTLAVDFLLTARNGQTTEALQVSSTNS
jgi:choline transport protein